MPTVLEQVGHAIPQEAVRGKAARPARLQKADYHQHPPGMDADGNSPFEHRLAWPLTGWYSVYGEFDVAFLHGSRPLAPLCLCTAQLSLVAKIGTYLPLRASLSPLLAIASQEPFQSNPCAPGATAGLIAGATTYTSETMPTRERLPVCYKLAALAIYGRCYHLPYCITWPSTMRQRSQIVTVGSRF